MMMAALAFALQAASMDTPKVDVTQAKLDVMTDACKAPRKWLKHLGGEEVSFQPSPRAKFKKVDCVLKHLRESVIPMKLGFVGNEQVSEEKK